MATILWPVSVCTSTLRSSLFARPARKKSLTVISTARVATTTEFYCYAETKKGVQRTPFSCRAICCVYKEFPMSAIHDLTLRALDGQELPLSPYKGQLMLVVNVASHCGLTPQYAGLETLHQQY